MDPPDLEGVAFKFTWDRDGAETVVRCGREVLWREPLAIEDARPFEAAARRLRERYGERACDLIPTRTSRDALIGDSFRTALKVHAVRTALVDGTELPEAD